MTDEPIEPPSSPDNRNPAPLEKRIHSPPDIRDQAVGTCEGCGAPLSGHVFFCLVCGRPYREAPGSRALPPPTSESKRLKEGAPDFWPVFWTYALALFASLILSIFLFAGDPNFEAYALVISSILLLMVTLALGTRHIQFLSGSLRRVGFNTPAAWGGLVLLAPLLGLNLLWHGPVLQGLLGYEGDLNLLQAGLSPVAAVVLLCVFPAVTEEVGFRGLLQPMMAGALDRKKAIWGVALLFAAIHLSAFSFPYLILVGLLLGWVRDRTGSLYPGMLIHALHNWFVVAFYWLG